MWKIIYRTQQSTPVCFIRRDAQLKSRVSASTLSTQLPKSPITSYRHLSSRYYSVSSLLRTDTKPVNTEFIATTNPIEPSQVVDVTNLTIGQSEPFLRLTDFAYYNYPWDPLIYSIQFVLDGVHIMTGLPWWGTIIGFAVLSRMAIAPLLVKQTRVTQIMTKIQPELNEVRTKSLMNYKKDKAAGKKSSSGVMETSMAMNKVFEKYGLTQFSVFKYTLPQAAILISCFVSLNLMSRDISMMNIQSGLKSGGLFWFHDLASMDPFFLLPVISMTTTAGLILATPTVRRSPTVTALIVVGVSAVTLIFTYQLPAALHLFWIVSNSLTLGFTQLLKMKSVKDYFDIPEIEEAGYSKDVKLYDHRPIKKAKL